MGWLDDWSLWRIDVYIELLTEDWGEVTAVNEPFTKWWEVDREWGGRYSCKEVSGLIFVIIINNPLSSHV